MKKILITGGCGFVGSNISLSLNKLGYKIYSLDNLVRKGSLYNLQLLKKARIKNLKIDIFDYKKISKTPKFDLIIDCCAEAAVEVSRNQLDKVINTNLIGTFNILKKAKKDNSKVIFLSSSRVYSISSIDKILNKKIIKKRITIKKKIDENFDVSKPKSIYGFTKLASEMLIEEFSYAFGIKFIINRCGVLSGPLQFGKQDQGFVSLWIWHHILKKKLKYIGYGGYGHQLRDVLHIYDLVDLIKLQIKKFDLINNKTFNVGGSNKSFTSLKQLTHICEKITGNKINFSKKLKTSIYDIPYFITNNKKVTKTYRWAPRNNIIDIAQDIYKWMLSNKVKIKKFL
ncbi:NAD-dependent epimerase/dehydratase family protein [Pelagibacteraceae bacterium]|nr:NAD-dependent epimerase/dehydratase family protein [Pelagibacteraceae bacterium]